MHMYLTTVYTYVAVHVYMLVYHWPYATYNFINDLYVQCNVNINSLIPSYMQTTKMIYNEHLT